MARCSILEAEEEPSIDLSPMIDCIFILLIFFIVTTVFVEEQGIPVNKPDASAASSPEESENLLIEITAEDEVLFDGRSVSLGDVTRRVRNHVSDAGTPVMLRAHERSAHGTFVRVWEAARLGGAEKLGFTTVN